MKRAFLWITITKKILQINYGIMAFYKREQSNNVLFLFKVLFEKVGLSFLPPPLPVYTGGRVLFFSIFWA